MLTALGARRKFIFNDGLAALNVPIAASALSILDSVGTVVSSIKYPPLAFQTPFEYTEPAAESIEDLTFTKIDLNANWSFE